MKGLIACCLTGRNPCSRQGRVLGHSRGRLSGDELVGGGDDEIVKGDGNSLH